MYYMYNQLSTASPYSGQFLIPHGCPLYRSFTVYILYYVRHKIIRCIKY